MGLGDDVKQVASDVGGALGGVVSDTAKTVAKTPLDILEEILGGGPTDDGKKTPEALDQVEKNGGATDNAAHLAAMQQKIEEDKHLQAAKLERHREVMESEKQLYEQKMAQEDQQKKIMKQQEEEQKKFEIKQLEKQRNYQVKAAQDAANPEKSRNVGAG